MRNSISVVFVVIAIIVAVASTFGGGVAEAHAAGGFVTSGGGYGLLLAALVGLMGAALKPNNGPSKDEAIEAAFRLAAYEAEAEALAAWPIWEGFILPECLTPEAGIRIVSEGIEITDELLRVRSSAAATVSISPRQAKAIQQQRAIKAELARKDLTNTELFSLGCALMQAKKGLLA